MFKSILVLESPWDSKSVRASSVWPFVNEFARATDIKAFYQPFADKDSFTHWVLRFHKDRRVPSPKLLYVAAHGGSGRIGGLRKDLNRKTILAACRRAKSLKYVYFGSCLFGTEENLSDLLKAARHLTWVAGYEKEVSWVDSTLFDVLLWSRMVSREEHSKGLHFQYIAQGLLAEIPGLARNLGFRFQYRRGKKIWSLQAPDMEVD